MIRAGGGAALVAAGLLVGLAGCAETDPYQRDGLWRPTGANTRNLAAMVARPTDLIRGRGEAGTPGFEAAVPVLRLAAGRPAPLPSSSTQAGAGAPASPGGAGAGAN